MKDLVMVSVVVPLYNAAEVIAETMQSILVQSWMDRNGLGINGGSTEMPGVRSMHVSASRERAY